MNTENYSSQEQNEPEPVMNQTIGQQETRQPPPYRNQNVQRKSPALASVLSLMPGMGQVYVGYYRQGFTFIAVFASTIATLASNRLQGLEPLLGIFLAFFLIFNLIDANRRAHHYNRVMAGLKIDEVPEDFKLPSAGGSRTTGLVLVAIGVLFILDLNYNVSMEWIEDWWPAILVAIGINMVVKSGRKKD